MQLKICVYAAFATAMRPVDQFLWTVSRLLTNKYLKNLIM